MQYYKGKKGEICNMEDTNIPDGQRMKQVEESGYKYLVLLKRVK